jgi:hypothetical protein
MKRQTIAPHYHLKANLLDALGVALLMMFMAAMGCAVLILSSPSAKADVDNAAYAYAAQYGSAVCNVLDTYPSFGGVIGIAKAIVKDGLSSYQAGEVIQVSVEEICPRHQGLLDRFVTVYTPASGRAA